MSPEPTVSLIRQPEGLCPPMGRYSHVAVAPPGAQLVAIAGQLGVEADGSRVGGVPEQTRQAFLNLGTALRSAGSSYAELIKTTTFLVGADSIEPFMAARANLFAEIFPDGEYPPNTLLVISRLVEPGLDVEIEGLAVRRTDQL